MSKQTSRREFIQTSAVVATSGLLGSASISGCTDQQTTELSKSDLYDKGLAPVSSSRWPRDDKNNVEYPELTEDLESDVLVVGGGLAGTSLCLHLAESGVRTALIESRQPGWGASGRNAGHVLPFMRNTGAIRSLPGKGEQFMEIFTQNEYRVFGIAEKYKIDCDASQVGLLEAIEKKSEFDKAKAFGEKNRSLYPLNVRFLENGEMREATGSDRYSYGVLWEDGGRINPYLFTRGMAKEASARGARIFGNSAATNIEKHGSQWRVLTAKGSVTAKRIVFCTNAYTPGFMHGLDKSYSPVIPYALSTKPIPDELRELIMPMGATMEQFPLNLHSFLIDRSGRIITSLLPRYTRPADGKAHFDDLIWWLHKTWPESQDFNIELEDYWTGRTAFSVDGLPKIYRLESNVLALTNFSGWGNSTAPLLGKHLAEAIAKDDLNLLTVPVTPPHKVTFPGWTDFMLRGLLLPMGRIAEKLSLI